MMIRAEINQTEMKKTIDELLQCSYWIIDILPSQVPKDSPGQYFAVEDYFLPISKDVVESGRQIISIEVKFMSKKSGTAALVVAIISLILSVLNLALAQKPAEPETRDIQYVMYLGTNDKDSNEPVYSLEEAKVRAADILVEHFGGYTIQEANGGWLDGEILYQENTLVIFLSDTTLDAVHAAADDLIQAFNQSSILIQANETSTEFYSHDY